jgi:hypothetical protein
MADFISSISALSSISSLNSLTDKKTITDIATLISHSAVDSVNFSDVAKNHYNLSDINSKLDEILGIVKNDKEALSSIGSLATSLFEDGSLSLRSIDPSAITKAINEIYSDKKVDNSEKKKLQMLTSELYSYIQNQAISQLFANDSDNIFKNPSINSQELSQLTDTQKVDLAKLSKQLTPILFDTNSDDATSFLRTLGSSYGINETNSDQNDQLLSLLNQANSNLSSILLNKDREFTYKKA